MAWPKATVERILLWLFRAIFRNWSFIAEKYSSLVCFGLKYVAVDYIF
jgi:hypothetical protein